MDILAIYNSLPDGAIKEIAVGLEMSSPGARNRLLGGDRRAWEIARSVVANFAEKNATLDLQIEELLRVRLVAPQSESE